MVRSGATQRLFRAMLAANPANPLADEAEYSGRRWSEVEERLDS